MDSFDKIIDTFCELAWTPYGLALFVVLMLFLIGWLIHSVIEITKINEETKAMRLETKKMRLETKRLAERTKYLNFGNKILKKRIKLARVRQVALLAKFPGLLEHIVVPQDNLDIVNNLRKEVNPSLGEITKEKYATVVFPNIQLIEIFMWIQKTESKYPLAQMSDQHREDFLALKEEAEEFDLELKSVA